MASPQKLGRYELLEQLGEGGMGSVWLARLTGTGGFEKLCIVKTVLPAIAKDESFVSRFLHEGRVLTQLQHSNIAQVFDMGDEAGTLYIALEYVAGIDLAQLHQHVRDSKQALPVPVAIFLIQQAAEGLGAAHRKVAVDGTPLNVVHRDVSPQNIMVSYEGEVKVIDFGIAKTANWGAGTEPGTLKGKFFYMSPEMILAKPVDHRADIFAAGTILWELFSGQRLFAGNNEMEMMHKVRDCRVPSVHFHNQEAPDMAVAIVRRATLADRALRFQTASEMAKSLEVLARRNGWPTTVDALTPLLGG